MLIEEEYDDSSEREHVLRPLGGVYSKKRKIEFQCFEGEEIHQERAFR